MIHYSSKIFLPSEIRIMNHRGSDKLYVCRNALQTSLIREKSGEEFRALLIAKSKTGCKVTIFFANYQTIHKIIAHYATFLTSKRGKSTTFVLQINYDAQKSGVKQTLKSV